MGDDLHLKDISFEDLLDSGGESGQAGSIGALVEDDFRNVSAASGEVSYIFSSALAKSGLDLCLKLASGIAFYRARMVNIKIFILVFI